MVVDGQTVSNRMWSIVEAGKQRNSAIADDRIVEAAASKGAWKDDSAARLDARGLENVSDDARTYRLTGVIDGNTP